LGNSYAPDVAVSGAKVYVVWDDDQSGNFEIYFRKSTDGSNTWQTATKITNSSGSSLNPRIAVNASQVFVVYEDDTPGNKEIYIRYSPF